MHNIEYREYEEATPKYKILEYVSQIVSRNGDGYGTDRIKFFDDVICENAGAAIEYIRSIDSDFYGGYAVKYYDFSKVKDSKKVKELQKKIDETMDKRRAFADAHSVKNLKAAFIGCSVCGSRLNKDLLASQRCPLCHEDLRSASTLARLASFDARCEEYKSKIKQEQLKNKKQAKVMWLVKFEWHS